MKKKAQIIITWDPATETNIRVTQEFKALDGLSQADCLKDALWQLEQMYNKSLKKMEKGFAAIAKEAREEQASL